MPLFTRSPPPSAGIISSPSSPAKSKFKRRSLLQRITGSATASRVISTPTLISDIPAHIAVVDLPIARSFAARARHGSSDSRPSLPPPLVLVGGRVTSDRLVYQQQSPSPISSNPTLLHVSASTSNMLDHSSSAASTPPLSTSTSDASVSAPDYAEVPYSARSTRTSRVPVPRFLNRAIDEPAVPHVGHEHCSGGINADDAHHADEPELASVAIGSGADRRSIHLQLQGNKRTSQTLRAVKMYENGLIDDSFRLSSMVLDEATRGSNRESVYSSTSSIYSVDMHNSPLRRSNSADSSKRSSLVVNSTNRDSCDFSAYASFPLPPTTLPKYTLDVASANSFSTTHSTQPLVTNPGRGLLRVAKPSTIARPRIPLPLILHPNAMDAISKPMTSLSSPPSSRLSRRIDHVDTAGDDTLASYRPVGSESRLDQKEIEDRSSGEGFEYDLFSLYSESVM